MAEMYRPEESHYDCLCDYYPEQTASESHVPSLPEDCENACLSAVNPDQYHTGCTPCPCEEYSNSEDREYDESRDEFPTYNRLNEDISSMSCCNNKKRNSQSLNLNKLEESYWAQWKPGKSQEVAPMYVQCKACMKYKKIGPYKNPCECLQLQYLNPGHAESMDSTDSSFLETDRNVDADTESECDCVCHRKVNGSRCQCNCDCIKKTINKVIEEKPVGAGEVPVEERYFNGEMNNARRGSKYMNHRQMSREDTGRSVPRRTAERGTDNPLSDGDAGKTCGCCDANGGEDIGGKSGKSRPSNYANSRNCNCNDRTSRTVESQRKDPKEPPFTLVENHNGPLEASKAVARTLNSIIERTSRMAEERRESESGKFGYSDVNGVHQQDASDLLMDPRKPRKPLNSIVERTSRLGEERRESESGKFGYSDVNGVHQQDTSDLLMDPRKPRKPLNSIVERTSRLGEERRESESGKFGYSDVNGVHQQDISVLLMDPRKPRKPLNSMVERTSRLAEDRRESESGKFGYSDVNGVHQQDTNDLLMDPKPRKPNNVPRRNTVDRTRVTELYTNGVEKGRSSLRDDVKVTNKAPPILQKPNNVARSIGNNYFKSRSTSPSLNTNGMERVSRVMEPPKTEEKMRPSQELSNKEPTIPSTPSTPVRSVANSRNPVRPTLGSLLNRRSRPTEVNMTVVAGDNPMDEPNLRNTKNYSNAGRNSNMEPQLSDVVEEPGKLRGYRNTDEGSQTSMDNHMPNKPNNLVHPATNSPNYNTVRNPKMTPRATEQQLSNVDIAKNHGYNDEISQEEASYLYVDKTLPTKPTGIIHTVANSTSYNTARNPNIPDHTVRVSEQLSNLDISKNSGYNASNEISQEEASYLYTNKTVPTKPTGIMRTVPSSPNYSPPRNTLGPSNSMDHDIRATNQHLMDPEIVSDDNLSAKSSNSIRPSSKNSYSNNYSNKARTVITFNSNTIVQNGMGIKQTPIKKEGTRGYTDTNGVRQEETRYQPDIITRSVGNSRNMSNVGRTITVLSNVTDQSKVPESYTNGILRETASDLLMDERLRSDDKNHTTIGRNNITPRVIHPSNIIDRTSRIESYPNDNTGFRDPNKLNQDEVNYLLMDNHIPSKPNNSVVSTHGRTNLAEQTDPIKFSIPTQYTYPEISSYINRPKTTSSILDKTRAPSPRSNDPPVSSRKSGTPYKRPKSPPQITRVNTRLNMSQSPPQTNILVVHSDDSADSPVPNDLLYGPHQDLFALHKPLNFAMPRPLHTFKDGGSPTNLRGYPERDKRNYIGDGNLDRIETRCPPKYHSKPIVTRPPMKGHSYPLKTKFPKDRKSSPLGTRFKF